MPEPKPVFLQADDLEALLEGISAYWTMAHRAMAYGQNVVMASLPVLP